MSVYQPWAQEAGIVWTSLKPLPSAIRNGEAVAMDGTIYVVGGFRSNDKPSGSIYAYHPESDTWETMHSLTYFRPNLALASLGGKLYAIGGDRFSNALEIFDPAKNTWSPGEPMPTERQHVDCGVVDGKIYVMGGLENWVKVSGKNEAYDPAKDSWQECAPIPTPRNNPAVEVVDGKIYVIGGGGDKQSIWTCLGDVEVYDPKSDSWEVKRKMPFPFFKPATAVVDGKIYVLGGQADAPYDAKSVFAYDPALDTWERIGELPSPRYFAGVAAIGNRVFVIGGCGDDFAASDAALSCVVQRRQ